MSSDFFDITMTEEQYQQAVRVGTLRYDESKKRGLQQAYGAGGYDLSLDILGATGELAYCIYTDQPWSESVNTFKAPDVGHNVQIRTTRVRNGRLIVRKRDSDEDFFVLIIADEKQFKIVGGILGKEAKREEFLDAPSGRPPAWFVSQDALKKIEDKRKQPPMEVDIIQKIFPVVPEDPKKEIKRIDNVFSKICGHEALRNTLSNLIDKQGSFLFYGPPSAGKRTIANAIAQYDLCVDKKNDTCTCKSCRIIQKGHPDLLEIGRNGKVLVEDVDALIDFTSRAPLMSRTKVAVIDSVESATPEAANRLLKTLEESSFSFFLISSDSSRVLPTVVSRCFKVKFESLSSNEIADLMMKKLGFDALSSRTLGWIGSSVAIDIFSNAGVCLKCRDMACEFISTIRDLLKSLDFIDRVETAHLGIFCDMLIMVLTDILFLKNGIEDIINADKRDILQKMSKILNDVAIVTSLSFFTQVKKYAHLNVNLGLSLKSTLVKVHPLLAQL